MYNSQSSSLDRMMKDCFSSLCQQSFFSFLLAFSVHCLPLASSVTGQYSLQILLWQVEKNVQPMMWNLSKSCQGAAWNLYSSSHLSLIHGLDNILLIKDILSFLVVTQSNTPFIFLILSLYRHRQANFLELVKTESIIPGSLFVTELAYIVLWWEQISILGTWIYWLWIASSIENKQPNTDLKKYENTEGGKSIKNVIYLRLHKGFQPLGSICIKLVQNEAAFLWVF